MTLPVVASTLVGTALLALVAELVGRLFRRRPALAAALWLLVLVRSLVPSVPFFSAPSIEASALGWPLLATPEPADVALASGGAWLGGARAWCSLAWGVGIAVLLARALHASLVLRQCLRLASSASAELMRDVERAARRLGVAPPRVRSLAGTRSPFLFGVFRPTLFWPEGAGPASPRARRAILLHELAHLKRRDPWTAWIETAASCLWWWNPLVWYAVLQSRRYRELACDAWVVEHEPDGRKAYAQALIDAVRRHALPPRAARTLGWLGSGSRVRERLTMLYVERPVGRSTRFAGAFALAAFASSLPGFTRETRPAPAPPAISATTTRVGATSSEAVPAETPSAPPALSDGDRAALERIGVESFAELERLSLDALAVDPNNARALSRLGWALLSRGEAVRAAEAFERQYDLGHVTTYASYNAACCWAMLGETERALDWLERSVESGFDDPLSLESDDDLAALRGDPRFRELIDTLVAQARATDDAP